MEIDQKDVAYVSILAQSIKATFEAFVRSFRKKKVKEKEKRKGNRKSRTLNERPSIDPVDVHRGPEAVRPEGHAIVRARAF